ncbi:hypothetical protein [Marinagarivorans cellulosilyticus]|uniref:ApeI dehydratase-like domain-containing protein n=1 Tax=Marinagarivorans cellulosilyticus TaxID=2721545 RepID=A0AAN1WFU2_9GAMM|nr:hypothetical protein [Marinagarivorans cellulosilyticus]BCD96817.1 hypothetical protein MARGE09_P1017 [Marinagarivorans cellulosilyticus]
MEHSNTTNAPKCDHLEIQVPPSHPCFDGHFPSAPLVPGALLLKWLAQALFQQYGEPVSRIKQIKFYAPITPGMLLYIESTLAKNTVKLTVSSAGKVLLAAGQFTLSAPKTQEPA